MRNFVKVFWVPIAAVVIICTLARLDALDRHFQQEQEMHITDDAHCAYCASYGHVSPAAAQADRLVKLYGRILHDSTRLLGNVRNALNQDNEMDDTIRRLLVFSQSAIQEIRCCAGTRKAQLQGTNVVFNISKESLEALEVLEEKK